MVVLAILSRLIDHPANFSPIMAIALFGAAFFQDIKFALLVPVSAMFVSDAIIGFHPAMPAVYLAFGIAFILGYLVLRKKVNIGNVILTSLAGSVIFFIITNLYVWAFDPFKMYEFSFAGLLNCFELALPFFRNMVAGDIVYAGVLFGAWVAAEKFLPNLVSITENK